VGESGVNANIHLSTSFGQGMNYWTMQCLPGVCRAQESEGKFGWFVHLNVDSATPIISMACGFRKVVISNIRTTLEQE
jgi:hypothetical protein